LRNYTPEEADALMRRSFGQYQKRRAGEQTRERLENARRRLEDVKGVWDCDTCSLEDMAEYYRIEERRQALQVALRRLRREAGAERRSRRGRRPRAPGVPGPQG